MHEYQLQPEVSDLLTAIGDEQRTEKLRPIPARHPQQLFDSSRMKIQVWSDVVNLPVERGPRIVARTMLLQDRRGDTHERRCTTLQS